MITSKQDANQVLKLAFDDATQSLRITGSSIPGSMTVDQTDGSKLHVTVDSSALPTGAATEAKQDGQISALDSLAVKSASGMVTVPFDEQVITYVGATTDVNQVIYKNARVTVATVTLSYDGNGRLTGVVRS